MRTYTEAEVGVLIKKSVTATIRGTFNFIESEHVIIIDSETRKEVEGVELDFSSDDADLGILLMNEYVAPCLREVGVVLAIDLKEGVS